MSESMRILCPFHKEKTPSMFLKDGIAKCFSCGIEMECAASTEYIDGEPVPCLVFRKVVRQTEVMG